MTLLDAPAVDAPSSAQLVSESRALGRDSLTRTERAREARWTRAWPWVLVTVAFVGYFAFGLWLVYGAEYAIGDALSRAASARSIAHSRDQHLMGVGFYWMPLPTFAQAPFMAVLSRIGHPLVAMPLTTAIAGALTIPPLVRAGRMMGVRERTIFLVVLQYALNPYTIFFAANGMSEVWAGLFLALTVERYLRWTVDRKMRDLGALAIWLALALLSKYEVLACVPIFGLLVGLQTRKGRRVSTAAVAVLPAAFTFLVWTVVALMITGRHPFDLVLSGGEGQRLENVGWTPEIRTPLTSLSYVTKMSLLVAPGFFVAALVAGAVRELADSATSLIRRRGGEALRLPALGALLPFVIFPGQVGYLLLKYSTFGNPRYFTPLILSFTLLALITIGRATGSVRERQGTRRRPARTLFGVAAVALFGALGVANAASAVSTLENRRASKIESEWIFMDVLRGRSEAVDGSLTRWTAFTDQVDELLTADDLLAIDSGVAFPFTLLTEHPKVVVLDRDKNSERLTSRNPVPFTYIIYVDGVESRSVMNGALKDALARPPRGTQWVVELEGPTKEFALGNVLLYRLVPLGGTSSGVVPTTDDEPQIAR